MLKHIAYQGVAVAAAAALSGLCAGGAAASDTAPGAGQPAGHAAVTAGQAAAVPGTRLWVQRYNGPANSNDQASSVAVSPTGSEVFVTGTSAENATDTDYATVAYDAATGAQLWVQRYNGPGGVKGDRAAAVAVSPTGDTVFVTGTSDGGATADDYATVAYDAATGAQLWVQRYNGPANGYDSASSVAVSPTGDTVFVTGSRAAANKQANYATVAYNAATGAQRWVHSYNGPVNGQDVPRAMAVSPAGGTVFVTGFSWSDKKHDYATVAYNAATGAQLWVQRYDGGGNRDDNAVSVTVSPGGGRVFVTGNSIGPTGGEDYATVAYRAPNGVQLWASRYNGPADFWDFASSVAVSPTGGTVFVTGASIEAATSYDYATLAYDPATGTQLWVQRYNGPGNSSDDASSVVVSPTGSTVYVAGASVNAAATSYDYATVAYDPATGAQLWAKRYNGPGNYDDQASSVAVSPPGDKVFVTGYSDGPFRNGETWADYATIAYSG
jgi:hypothetical protein